MGKSIGVAALILLPLVAVASEPIVSGLSNWDQHEASFAGRVLVSELSCTACHSADIEPKGGPRLDQIGARVNPSYLEQFIRAPDATKPGTTMPDMLAGLSEDERESVASAIADYLCDQTDQEFALQPIDLKRIVNGRKLYHKIGCVACHSPEDKPLPDSPPLIGLDQKYSLNSLAAFLENPLAVRPSGRMPDMHLTYWEALDLASYLLRDQVVTDISKRSTGRSAEGKVLFKKYGCRQCHQSESAQADFAKPLKNIASSATCSTAGFTLSALQKQQIKAVLDSGLQPPKGEAAVQDTLTKLNCVACHQRGELGGPTVARDDYFTTTNLNLGDQARIPPSLTGVGAKLKPNWLRQVLVSGVESRPYMNTRMPKFGSDRVSHLVEALAELDRLEQLVFERTSEAKKASGFGRDLVGSNNLSCIACHTFKGETATTLGGIELTRMTDRLYENWFHHYLLNPHKFHPTTIMPNFWPGGKSVRPEILDDDAGKQIDAIWQYLERGQEARSPSGLKRVPIVYRADKGEAIMLRRQYNGIGKRGIGVGYPSGINLSFDAGQLRLGSIWEGVFGDLAGVWRGQGSRNVDEMTSRVVRFPIGPAFATLESPDSEWPILEQGQRARGFQLLGYALDEKQRPTFKYRYAGVVITDYFLDAPGKLTRSLSFDKAMPADVYFRIGVESDQPRILTIEHSLDGDALVVPLAGERELTINYQFLTE